MNAQEARQRVIEAKDRAAQHKTWEDKYEAVLATSSLFRTIELMKAEGFNTIEFEDGCKSEMLDACRVLGNKAIDVELVGNVLRIKDYEEHYIVRSHIKRIDDSIAYQAACENNSFTTVDLKKGSLTSPAPDLRYLDGFVKATFNLTDGAIAHILEAFKVRGFEVSLSENNEITVSW